MKLTDTQKDFRKYMEQTNNKTDIYGNLVIQNGKKDKGLGILISIVALFFLLFIVGYSYFISGAINNNEPFLENQHKELSDTIKSSSVLPVTVVESDNRVLTKRQAELLEPMNQFFVQINSSLSTIAKIHQQPWEQRNIPQYRQALINAIAICDNYKNNIESKNPDPIFQPLLSVGKDLIVSLKMALQYYLEYTHSKKSSDIDLGNYYNKLFVQQKEQYFSELRTILNENGFRFETINDGKGIRYWYSKSKML